MKTIIEIAYQSRARNAEHYQLYALFPSIITEEFSTKYKLTAARARFMVSLAKENEAYLQNRAYEGTQLLNEKNAVCDRRYRAFEFAVQSKQLSDTAAEANAADRIAFLMSPYKGAPNKPHAENVIMVKDLVEQLESDKYATDIETLGLTTQVASLKSSVKEFEAALSGRAVEQLVRTSSDKMQTVRPVVERDFADLAQLISAVYLVAAYVDVDTERAAELESVVDAVNAEIIRFQNTLSRRGAGNSSTPGKDEETPDTPDKDEEDDKPIVV